jgi:hypothetical protein
MLATSKIKWFGSIILAGILLVMALMGGNWGNAYSVNASVNAAPFIYSIVPSHIRVGSPDTLLEINGANFGNMTDTQVRLTAGGVDVLLTRISVSSTRIIVIIPAYLLGALNQYTITVIKTTSGTIPEISNPKTLQVVLYLYYYLPIMYK